MDCCLCSSIVSIFRPLRNTICASCYEGAKCILALTNKLDNPTEEEQEKSKGLAQKGLTQAFNQLKQLKELDDALLEQYISKASNRYICFLPYALQTSSYDTKIGPETNFLRAWIHTNGRQLMPDSNNNNTRSTSGSSSTSSSSKGSGDGDMKKKSAKKKTFWVCEDCGDSFGQWWGHCQSCKNINTLKRFTESLALETEFVDSVVSGIVLIICNPSFRQMSLKGLMRNNVDFLSTLSLFLALDLLYHISNLLAVSSPLLIHLMKPTELPFLGLIT
jgi:hypothetical protein